MKPGFVCLLILAMSVSAAAQLREPAHVSVRDFYSWPLSLPRDAKPGIGLVSAERVFKLRLDPPKNQGQHLVDESIKVCVIDRYCKSVTLLSAGENSPELDFSEELARISEEYGKATLEKLYVTIQREQPLVRKSVNLVVMIETDFTMPLPDFNLVQEVLDQNSPAPSP